jgi:hypothetical protein
MSILCQSKVMGEGRGGVWDSRIDHAVTPSRMSVSSSEGVKRKRSRTALRGTTERIESEWKAKEGEGRPEDFTDD